MSLLTRRALLATGGVGAVALLSGAKPYRPVAAPVVTGIAAGDGGAVVWFEELHRKEKVLEYEVEAVV